MKKLVLFAVALLMGTTASAQQQATTGRDAANTFVRVTGILTEMSSDALKVRDTTGHEVSLLLGPGIAVVAARRVAPGSIKRGDFVASANLSESDGVGRSLEIRLFEPGSHAGEGNRPMVRAGDAPGQMMTNATVTKVTQTHAGLELDVQYPGGVRHLIVPADVPITGFYPVAAARLKSGTPVIVIATRSSGGGLIAGRIQIAAPPSTTH